MKKAKAIELIKKQVDEISVLKTFEEGNKKYQDWRENTVSVIGQIFGKKTDNYNRVYGHLFDEGFIISCEKQSHRDLYLKELNGMDSMLCGMITEIEMWEEDAKTESKDAVEIVQNICNRFHQVARQIRKRYNGRTTIDVEDEYDVQDLLHALLRLHFDDVRAEEWTPSYAGTASRMDFLLKQEKIVIEVKKTRKNLGEKEVGGQLAIDIQRYQVHPDCETLICFVYDPEARVANPAGIENDLNRDINNLKVITIITPK